MTDKLSAADRLLRWAYEHFKRSGEWPTTRAAEIELDDVLEPEGGIETVCGSLGSDNLTCGSPEDPNAHVVVRLLGLVRTGLATEDIEMFLGATRFVAERYRASFGAEKDIDLLDYVCRFPMNIDDAKRLTMIVHDNGSYWQSIGGTRLRPNRLAGKLFGVSTVEDYLARVSASEERARQLAIARGAKSDRAARFVFFSHAADDAPVAEYVASVLRTSVGGLELFVASSPGAIPTGEEWLAAIKRNLKAADTYLILLTPRSIERLWIWFETGAAWMSDRRLLPVTALGLEKRDVPLPLGAHQVLSLENVADVQQLFRDLRIAVADAEKFARAIRDFREVEHRRERETSPPSSPISAALAQRQEHVNQQNRYALFQSTRGVQFAENAVRQTFDELERVAAHVREAEPTLGIRFGRKGDQIVVHAGGHSISVIWENRVLNSLRNARLYVLEAAGNFDLPGERYPSGGHVEKGVPVDYIPQFNVSEQVFWRATTTGDEFSAQEFAEYWIARLITKPIPEG